jgi:hypothetical protein
MLRAEAGAVTLKRLMLANMKVVAMTGKRINIFSITPFQKYKLTLLIVPKS